ncbi:MAG: phosphotransferase [Litoreibacter sp.]|nr:phosphotransferase [Litoreibacter sp.]
MSAPNTALPERLKVLDAMANEALALWDLPANSSAQLINISENATYLVQSPDGHKSILRVHRDHYHTRRAIECELAWLEALNEGQIVETSSFYTGKDGCAIQEVDTPQLGGSRFLVLFDFVEGVSPDEARDLTDGFEELGAIAARCHLHATSWTKPKPFERLVWDTDAVFGSEPTWGDWRNAPGVTNDVKVVLERVELQIVKRLAAYGKASDRYNLIHADMRLANILVGPRGTCLIDFDDCGYGWLMYDFAAAISFIEDDPRIPKCKEAWLKGYQTVRALSAEDLAEIDTFVMLRRMALLAWIGSHIEAPEPQKLAAGFAATTARLGQVWLDSLN